MKRGTKVVLGLVGGGLALFGAFSAGMYIMAKPEEPVREAPVAEATIEPTLVVTKTIEPIPADATEPAPTEAPAAMYWDYQDVIKHPQNDYYRINFERRWGMTPEEAARQYGW